MGGWTAKAACYWGLCLKDRSISWVTEKAKRREGQSGRADGPQSGQTDSGMEEGREVQRGPGSGRPGNRTAPSSRILRSQEAGSGSVLRVAGTGDPERVRVRMRGRRGLTSE